MAISVRAATMRIRFSDIIVKSKKVVEESGKDAVMRMRREKLRKEREEEKAMMEERALRQRLREEQRLALEKMAEEAKSDFHNDHLATMEIANLCGGSRMARSRCWMKKLGLVLKTTDDDDCDDDFYLEKAPRHRHGLDDYDLEEVIMQAFKEALQDICQVHLSVYSFILLTRQGKLIALSHSRAAL